MKYRCINCGCSINPIFIEDDSCPSKGEDRIVSKSPAGKYICPKCGKIVECAVDFSKKKL